jgi:hypothetical protein
MKYLKYGVGSLVIFAVLIGLVIVMYKGLETDYGITKGDTRNTTNAVTGVVESMNIMDRLDNLLILKGINQTLSGIYTIKEPSAKFLDILGALASTGIGVIKLTGGLIVFVPQVVYIIMTFYYIPPVVAAGFIILVIMFVGFLIIKAYTGNDT